MVSGGPERGQRFTSVKHDETELFVAKKFRGLEAIEQKIRKLEFKRVKNYAEGQELKDLITEKEKLEQEMKRVFKQGSSEDEN